MGKYKQIDHTADIAVEIIGDNHEDLLITAANCWREIVFGKRKFSKKLKKTIRIGANTIEDLIVEFLSELNFLFNVKKWIGSTVLNLKLTVSDSGFLMTAKVAGENFIENKHPVENEIKAVTFHKMQVKKTGPYLQTLIVFDT
jgi:SHS2 domain-containing protein